MFDLLIQDTSEYRRSIPGFLIDNGLRSEENPAWKKWKETQMRMLRSSLPIINIQGGNTSKESYEVVGSGFILTSHGRFFLVTAAHVWDESVRDTNSSYISILDEKHQYPLSHISSPLFRTPGIELSRSDDKLDFGYKELPADLVKLFLPWISPIHLNECRMEEKKDHNEWLTVVGWPTHFAKPRHSLKMVYPEPLALTVKRNPEEETKISSTVSTESNIILDISVLGHEKTSQPVDRIKLSGVSGGPVWALPTPEEWIAGLASPILAGITTERLDEFGNSAENGNRLLATSILLVLNQMMHSYPELVFMETQGNRIVTPT